MKDMHDIASGFARGSEFAFGEHRASGEQGEQA